MNARETSKEPLPGGSLRGEEPTAEGGMRASTGEQEKGGGASRRVSNK